MTKKLLLGLLVLTLIIVVSALCIPSHFLATPLLKAGVVDEQTTVTEQSNPLLGMKAGSALGGLSHDLVLNTPLPDTEEKIMVYKTLPPDISQETLKKLAKKFSVSGTLDDGTESEGIMSEDRNQSIEIDKDSGRVLYLNMDQKNRLNSIFNPETVPSDEESIRIATTFLSKRDLLPDGAVPREVEHRKTYTAIGDSDPSVSWEERVVWYGGTLNNYNVSGRFISVQINADGKIMEVYSNWRDYEPSMELPVKSPQDAFNELQVRGVAVGENQPDYVSIDQVSLRYNSLPGAYKENYLEPVYLFRGQAMLKGNSIQSVSESIPALLEEPPELISS